MTLQELQALREARERIADRDHWTTGFLSQNAEGGAVSPTDPTAVRWCALGSLCKSFNLTDVGVDDDPRDMVPLGHPIDELDDVAHAAFGDGMPGVNDDRGHEAVLHVYDELIATAEREVTP